MNWTLLRRGVAGGIALQLALLTAGCTDMLYSDNQTSSRRNAEARQAALRSMKLASSQADAARPIEGQALVQMLSGNTHVQPYQKRTGDSKPYLTHYDYYGADGTFIGRDTYSRRTVDYQDVGRWRVAADSLCISLPSMQAEENCYTIRLAADGAIQYWINKPGDLFHGLFTRNVKIVRPGLQEPEYTSDPEAFR